MYLINRSYCIAFAVLCTSGLSLASYAQQTGGQKEAQSVVASKTVKFATVKATDATVKKAIPANDLAALKKLLAKEATIKGVVRKIFSPDSHSIVVLNFADDYWTAATVAVKSRDFAKFPDFTTLQGKTVLVTGRIVEYKEKLQVELSEIKQLKIVP